MHASRKTQITTVFLSASLLHAVPSNKVIYIGCSFSDNTHQLSFGANFELEEIINRVTTKITYNMNAPVSTIKVL